MAVEALARSNALADPPAGHNGDTLTDLAKAMLIAGLAGRRGLPIYPFLPYPYYPFFFGTGDGYHYSDRERYRDVDRGRGRR